MGWHYTDHEINHASRYFFALWLFIVLLFFAFWAMGMSGPVTVHGQIADRNGRPVPDARAFVSVVALTADSMPFVGAPNEAESTLAEFQVGADGRFDFTVQRWRIVRLGVHFESKLASIEPAQWYPDSGIRHLLARQHYGSRGKPLLFKAIRYDEAG